MVKDAMDGGAERGLQAGNIEQTLNKLRKASVKDYLKYIKVLYQILSFGKKEKTITKLNRRGTSKVLKGNRKIKTKIKT